ncbi:hypothetical protein SLEP1_g14420 [Rubroshorea leprosula]|uniref:Uncharacterized protein n=1 Tax=Rubroshorea leprosula TaxID=152421 RepID=A0AAV5IRW2_9ROSI|nr:hypothetical protein SLEP1_g14420 [Rubroshorea leprosula]
MTTEKKMVMALRLMALVVLGGKSAGAQIHHVVGGDHGWDPSCDIAAWSSGRIFRVGDKICKSFVLTLYVSSSLLIKLRYSKVENAFF